MIFPLFLESKSISRLRRMADELEILKPEHGRVLVVCARTGTETFPLFAGGSGSGTREVTETVTKTAAQAWRGAGRLKETK